MDRPVHGTGRGNQVGVLQDAVRGHQPGIAAADQRLPCICSALNLLHMGAGKEGWLSQQPRCSGGWDSGPKGPLSGTSVTL